MLTYICGLSIIFNVIELKLWCEDSVWGWDLKILFMVKISG
jgi:hypothetical protein